MSKKSDNEEVRPRSNRGIRHNADDLSWYDTERRIDIPADTNGYGDSAVTSPRAMNDIAAADDGDLTCDKNCNEGVICETDSRVPRNGSRFDSVSTKSEYRDVGRSNGKSSGVHTQSNMAYTSSRYPVDAGPGPLAEDVFITSTPEPTDEQTVTLEERIQRTRHKFMAVYAFLQIPQSKVKPEPTPDQRDALRTFVKDRINDKEECWSILGDPDRVEEDEDKYRTRPRTSRESRLNIPRPEHKDGPVTRRRQGFCHLCQKSVFDAYPCRVCPRLFHLECLSKSGKCRPKEVENIAIPRALSATGWSCYICDDLCRLLKEDELQWIMEEFEKYDINKDASISFEEYMSICKTDEQLLDPQPNGELSDLDLVRLRVQFRSMDLDQDGKIDYWEFITSQATKMLANRPKEELAGYLEEQEIFGADQLFQTFDRDNDGRISEAKVKAVLRDWYSRLQDNSNVYTSFKDSQKALELHINLQTQMVMGTGTGARDGLTWEDFLREQAIYMICSRPNRADLEPMESDTKRKIDILTRANAS